VVVVVVAAIGGYALYRHNQPSSQTQAMRAFCAALAGATDEANVDDPGPFRIFQRLVDKDGLAVGGQVSSDTIGLEAAISANDTQRLSPIFSGSEQIAPRTGTRRLGNRNFGPRPARVQKLIFLPTTTVVAGRSIRARRHIRL